MDGIWRALASMAVLCLLGGWIGALVLFAVVVAPTAFSALPDSQTAGRVVGPVLRSLNLYGAIAGPILAALAIALGRGRLAIGLPLVLAAVCLYSQFGITAEIEEIRPLAFGQPPDPAALLRFGSLHRWSVTLYGVTGLSALALAFLHARTESRAPARR